jgi:hypothetical protein
MKKRIYFISLIITGIALLYSCDKNNDNRLPGVAEEIYVSRDNFNICLPDTLEFSINPIEKADKGEYKWIVEGGKILVTSNDTTIRVAVFDTHKFGDSLIVKVRGANQYGYGAYFEKSIIAKGAGREYDFTVEPYDPNMVAVYFVDYDENNNFLPLDGTVTGVEWILNNKSTDYQIQITNNATDMGIIDYYDNVNINNVSIIVSSNTSVCKSKFSININ